MVAVNPIDREIQLKLVYYGPGLGGKTTTLQYIHETTEPEHRGKMVSLATPVDRTLYFDYLPVRLPDIGGYTLKLQLFTVPGQVHFNATRKLVLSNADGVVFVADSQASRSDANFESLDNLFTNLADYKIDAERFPLVFQYNKRDLDNILPIETLDATLNTKGLPSLGTCAIRGDNVYESLELITKEVLRDLKRRDVLAREDLPVTQDRTLDFKRQEPGLADRLQEYSEKTVVSPMAASLRNLSEELPSKGDPVLTHPPQPLDRPTIPAPLALSEKVAYEQKRSSISKRQEAIKASPRERPVPVSHFSFSPLWPESDRPRAAAIEQAIAENRFGEVIGMAKEALDRIIEYHRLSVPNSSETTILALLGLEGRAYLEIARLNLSPPDKVTREQALSAYLFVLQAVEGSK